MDETPAEAESVGAAVTALLATLGHGKNRAERKKQKRAAHRTLKKQLGEAAQEAIHGSLTPQEQQKAARRREKRAADKALRADGLLPREQPRKPKKQRKAEHFMNMEHAAQQRLCTPLGLVLIPRWKTHSIPDRPSPRPVDEAEQESQPAQPHTFPPRESFAGKISGLRHAIKAKHTIAGPAPPLGRLQPPPLPQQKRPYGTKPGWLTAQERETERQRETERAAGREQRTPPGTTPVNPVAESPSALPPATALYKEGTATGSAAEGIEHGSADKAVDTADLSTVDLAAKSNVVAPVAAAANPATSMLHASRVLLVKVKQERDVCRTEKEEAIDDKEFQEEITKDVSLMLDRWQSYADVLKAQVRSLGGVPESWEGFAAPNRAAAAGM